MKQAALLATALVALMMAPAQAASDYVFNCRNEWAQSVMITLPAGSVDEARKLLKTERQYLEKYSLDRTSQCVFRSEIPRKHAVHTEEGPQEETTPSVTE